MKKTEVEKTVVLQKKFEKHTKAFNSQYSEGNQLHFGEFESISIKQVFQVGTRKFMKLLAYADANKTSRRSMVSDLGHLLTTFSNSLNALPAGYEFANLCKNNTACTKTDLNGLHQYNRDQDFERTYDDNRHEYETRWCVEVLIEFKKSKKA